MTINDVTAIAEDALFTIIKCSAPLLLVSLVVGLIVMGHWIINNMVEYMTRLWTDFNAYIR